MALQWEFIEGPGRESTKRAPVLRGWLVVHSLYSERDRSFIQPGAAAGGIGVGLGVGLTFVPDPNHEWQV